MVRKPQIQIPPEIRQSDKKSLEIVKIIGQGTFGSVSLCTRDGRRFVLKEMLRGNDPHEQKLFVKEATLLQMMDHENIVEFHSVVQDRSLNHSTLALLLEYVAFDFSYLGEEIQVSSLSDLVRLLDDSLFSGFEHFNKFIACDVANGLAYLHSNGIVHRDLKPANILVSNLHCHGSAGIAKYWQSRPIVAKLTDFGEGRTQMIQTASIVATKTSNFARGTPVFMAPEALCSDSLTSASMEDLKCMDVWSLGMVLFVLLNPDLHYPYQLELKESRATSPDMLQAVLKRQILRKQLPRHSKKYEVARKSFWDNILKAHEVCAQFTDRPSVKQVAELLDVKHTRYGKLIST